ncbi:hypothetical protein [Roseibium sediminicola]|uniref:Tat pathway signal sequence domain protein n=1 Tax=Roseibium sediminicola TaxID=2933272 RepID=A0ABT0GWY9_9HYPH|nr:hypothetical protein [Roseibium sp. CAU 1639]MCK7613755.1 hypothetical protein [Roseibium sp. CAU 1639]
MQKFLVPVLAALTCLSWPLTAPTAVAQPAEMISIQLNEAVTVDDACRLTFVIRNDLADTVQALGLDLVVFDTSEGVSGYAAVDFGGLPAGKTRVRQYDVLKGDCASIARVLLNDVRACEIGGSAGADCLPLLRLSSRSDIDLIL